MANRSSLVLRMAGLSLQTLKKAHPLRLGLSNIRPLHVLSRAYKYPSQKVDFASRSSSIGHYHLKTPLIHTGLTHFEEPLGLSKQPARNFHATGSKVKYLDFRYRLRTTHLRLNMLLIRRQKMKKHKLIKFRKKYKSLLAKRRLKREISKEKTFRVELLTYIRRAESFDPKEYALRKIAEAEGDVPQITPEEKLENLKELIRKNRYQTDYLKPKHRRAD